jgi:hypothetical protein
MQRAASDYSAALRRTHQHTSVGHRAACPTPAHSNQEPAIALATHAVLVNHAGAW